MKMKFKIISSIAMVGVSLLLLTGCSSDPDSAGLEYMPDMYRSPAIEPYVDYGEIRGREYMEVKMKLSAKVPPFGVVPYYGTDSTTVALMLPYKRKGHVSMKLTHGMYGAELTNVNEYELAAADKNPLGLNEDNAEDIFAEGKKLFAANCTHCHGEKGDGNGPMMKNGLFAGVPDYGNLKDLGDGQLFYSIYYGKGFMGAHNSILNKVEIWTLVHYIRKLQDAKYPKTGGEEDAAEEEELAIEDNTQ
jgi:mono/diheme cytochrome c family protein